MGEVIGLPLGGILIGPSRPGAAPVRSKAVSTLIVTACAIAGGAAGAVALGRSARGGAIGED